ncbi:16S rRNA (cytosine(1402)-N(4))-methyltransferase RsmH [Patescibacteria group bacterium]|nr:16S rRNA (cytosine(1402)-N(4))-methyltransferase RsmH [Patescibacteria group bacterium]
MHIPVLLNEAIHYLNPKPGQNFIDCTIGQLGHSIKILNKTKPSGKILGIDLSKQAIESSQKQLNNIGIFDRAVLVNDNFANLKKIVQSKKIKPIHGILLDLGLSTNLIEESNKGFSFMREELLDMRYGKTQSGLTAMKILNGYSEQDLADIFYEYGGERNSRKIARNIIEKRKIKKIKTTAELRDIVINSFKQGFHVKSLARVFQALRIEVNNELNNLKQVLEQSIDVLELGGRIVVISYHSLEDRIVKRFFKTQEQIKILTKRPITPSKQEIELNKRSRSAKLRAGEKK